MSTERQSSSDRIAQATGLRNKLVRSGELLFAGVVGAAMTIGVLYLMYGEFLKGLLPCNGALVSNEREAAGIAKMYLVGATGSGSILLRDSKILEGGWELHLQISDSVRDGNKYFIKTRTAIVVVDYCGRVFPQKLSESR